jgi:hypothetical protein
MTAGKQDLEIKALIDVLKTHLQTTGWGTIEFQDGFSVNQDIQPPFIAVHFLPNGPKPMQLGDTKEKYYERVTQIDCYMETKGRASSIIDDLMDYIDIMVVPIADPLNGNAIVGSITCQNTDSIYGEIAPPNLGNPKVMRWRAIVRATLDAHYPTG